MKNFKKAVCALMAVLMLITCCACGQSPTVERTVSVCEPNGELRRPISTEQPMWIVHIDSWNNADPEKIIDLIPEDILPYVVFNISLSISWDSDTKTWGLVNDGYECAKSWLRTCAEKNVWAMIQPGSGGQCHFPDYVEPSDMKDTIFEEFFRDYPNFLGFNYCEQFWGFDQEDFPTTYIERYKHFTNLLKLTHDYGGYLVVSWCGNQWGQALNPIAMLKQVPEFEQACLDYTENYILCEKHTQVGYLHDVESQVLGAYLSGYSGQAGLRYDGSGWTGPDGQTNTKFTMATGVAIHLERLMQQGYTVIDGPELIWTECFRETSAERTEQGYSSRKWEMYDQFQNVMIDIFRKVLDGTIRIPTREEVINNTKAVIIQDVDKGDDDAKYCSPKTLFNGLYKMDNDGMLRDNRNFFKKSGRYPTIPTVYALADDTAKGFEIQINSSEYNKRWGKEENKLAELNELFPEEYTGDIYARRSDNTWTVYNPYKSGQSAEGVIPFKYNTADKVELTLSQYSGGIISEYADSLKIYLNNYDNELLSAFKLKTDVIKVYGCTEEPTLTYNDRGVSQVKSKVNTSWEGGVFTATIKHNGPIDIEISAKGTESGRLTEYKTATLVEPKRPPVYHGPHQYEAENFDSISIQKNLPNGCRSGVDGFKGQGYMIFGSKEDAAVLDHVSVLEDGKYTLTLRYSSPDASISKLNLYVNGKKVSSPSLGKTSSASDWQEYTIEVKLNKGDNTVELKATGELQGALYLDCMIIS